MPETKALNFDTGLVTHTVNERCKLEFSPTDAYFAERLFNAFNRLHEQQKERNELGAKNISNAEVFEYHRKIEKEMRETIDGIFERPVCDDVFGGCSLYSMGNGLPQWLNFILSVMDEMDEAITKEKKATNPRIAKYMAKYHR